MSFKIIGRRREHHGKGGQRYVYITTEGEMYGATVAEKIGISLPGFNSRCRSYGYLDPRVVTGNKRGGRPSDHGGGNDEWRALSDEPRG